MKNILIPDELHHRIKVLTAIAGFTIQEFTEAAILAALRERHEAAILASRRSAANEPVPD